MKTKHVLSFALALSIVGSLPQEALANEPARSSVSQGIGFLPLDFYLDRRESLGLDEDQVAGLEQVLAGMREPGERIAEMIQNRQRALEEAVAENPVNREKTEERFEAVIHAENEMKSLQFRSRLEMRSILRPAQYEKVVAMAAKARSQESSSGSGQLQEELNRILHIVKERSGGKVPQDVIERLEQIRKIARERQLKEAEEQIDAILRDLGKGEYQDHSELESELRKMHETLEKADDPLQRERIEQEIQKLRQARAGRTPKARQEGGEGMEKTMRILAEAAERTDNPKVREQLGTAMDKLRGAMESGNEQVAKEILRAVKPLLEAQTPKP